MLAGFVPPSLGSPAAPPVAGDVPDAGLVGFDADGAAPAGSGVSAFGEALASACEAATKAAGEDLPDPVNAWSPGLPGVWLDLAAATGGADTAAASAAETDDSADPVVEDDTADREGAADPAITVAASVDAASTHAPSSARSGTIEGLAGDAAAAERTLAVGSVAKGTVVDPSPAVQADGSDRSAAVAMAGNQKEGGPTERTARPDDPVDIAADRQLPAGQDVPAGERLEAAGARTASSAEGEPARAESMAPGTAPTREAVAGAPGRESTATTDAAAASPGLPLGPAADHGPGSPVLSSPSAPSVRAGDRAAAAVHEAGHAPSALASEEAETRVLPGVGDGAAQDAAADDDGGDRGHAPPNESGPRAAHAETALQRPGAGAPPGFGALITAADGTLRLGAPVPPLGAGALAADEQIANLQRMVQTMRVMVRETVSQATVRLRPEHLGEVTIDVRVDGTSVSAVIHSESANVREWMQGQESTLRNGLSEHGLHLEKLQVQRDGRHDGREEPHQQPERRKARARQHDAAQGTFEITV